MKTNVTVTANDKDEVVVFNKTSEKDEKDYGYVRVESVKQSLEGGFAKISKRSAIIAGEMEVLKGFNLKKGQILQGQIVREESHTPWYPSQEPKINPTTKETIQKDGKLIYMKDLYTTDMSKVDSLIAHNKIAVGDAVIAAQGEALNS
jgi:hypothetical protein